MLSLQSLVSKLPSNVLSPILLTDTIELAAAPPETPSSADPSSASRALKLARKYTTSPKFVPAGTDARVWLARLEIERAGALEAQGNPLKAWAEARKCATGAEADVINVWLWGVPLPNADQNTETLLPDELNKQRTLFDVSAEDQEVSRNI